MPNSNDSHCCPLAERILAVVVTRLTRIENHLQGIAMTLDELMTQAQTTAAAIENAVTLIKTQSTDPAKVQAIGDVLSKATADLNAVIAPAPVVPPPSPVVPPAPPAA